MSFRYPAFVINLDRHPGRLAAFRERNAPTGIDIVRFAAVEGAKLGPIERTVISKTGRLTSGAIGCAASHRALWQLCVTLGRPIVVFEDDAELRHDLVAALPHAVASIGGPWDILLLGFNSDAPLALAGAGAAATPAPRRLRLALGTCGYAITPRGAARFLATCFPIDGRALMSGPYPGLASGIDAAMAIDYPVMDAFVCIPPLVTSPNDKGASSTGG